MALRRSVMKFGWAAASACATCSAIPAEIDDVGYAIGSSLPPAIVEAFAKRTDLAFEARINPYYLQGDFDGDGTRDTAVLVKHKKSGAHGIGFVFKGRRIVIAGAGQKLDDDPGDFDWMDAWYVESKGKVGQGASDEAPPKLKGDAIMAIKTEGASRLIYWDGKRFRWYQQGD